MTPGKYMSDHIDAVNELTEAGDAIVFVKKSRLPDAADPSLTRIARTTVGGVAIEKRGDPKEYEQLKLVEKDLVTLVFAATNYGDTVPLGANVNWNSRGYRVVSVRNVAPDGVPIISNVVIAK